MSPFRKKSKTQVDRLTAWRLDAVPGRRGFDDELGALFAELGLDAQRERRGWVAHLSDRPLFLVWIDDDRVLSGYVGLDDTRDPAELSELLGRNLDPWLPWFALGDAAEASLGARFKLPFDGFDREAVLLALETVTGLVGDDALSARARELRVPPGGEMAEQEAAARARSAVGSGLRASGLTAIESDDVWEIEVDRGLVRAILRDTGESVLFMHELAYEAAAADVDMLRWLLAASDWSGARLGLAPLPGGPGAFAACSVAAHDLQPQAVAWGVEQVLRIAEDYDIKTGRAP